MHSYAIPYLGNQILKDGNAEIRAFARLGSKGLVKNFEYLESYLPFELVLWYSTAYMSLGGKAYDCLTVLNTISDN